MPASSRKPAEAIFHDLIDLELAPDEFEERRHQLAVGMSQKESGEFEELIENYQGLREILKGKVETDRTGQLLGGFQLLKRLGQGATSEVWIGRDQSMDRLVAVKILHFHLSLCPDSLARFKKEATACGRLEHVNIAKMFTLGECDGIHYIVQELISDGQDLRAWLHDIAQEPSLSLEHFRHVGGICADVAEALQHAHDRNVIHRDVKPGNILLSADGIPKLVDFGLASLRQEGNSYFSTSCGGTPLFMSPEQVDPDRDRVDARTDVFSLGGTLYELLTRCRPFPGKSSAAVFHAILNRDPLHPDLIQPEIPKDLITICMHALEKRPEHRYQTAQAFADDLRRFLAKEPILAKEPSRWHRISLWTSRHPSLTAAIGVSILAFLITATSLARVLQSEAALKIALLEVNAEQAKNQEAVESYRREANYGRAVHRFFVDSMVSFPRERLQRSQEPWREVVDAALDRVNLRHPEPGPYRTALLHAVGGMYREVLLSKEAEAIFRSALEEMQGIESSQSFQRRECLIQAELAATLLAEKNAEEARDLLLDCQRRAAELWLPDAADRWKIEIWLAAVESELGDAQGAEERLLNVRQAVSKAGLIDVDILAQKTLVQIFFRAGKYQAVLDEMENLKGRGEKQGGFDLATDAQLGLLAGHSSFCLGNFSKAEQLFRGALVASAAFYGEDSLVCSDIAGALASTLCMVGEYEEGLALARDSMETIHAAVGNKAMVFQISKQRVGIILLDMGDEAAAMQIFAEVYQDVSQNAGPGDELAFGALNNLAVAALSIGRGAEVLAQLDAGFQQCVKRNGAAHPTTLSLQINLAEILCTGGESIKGIALLEKAILGLSELYGEGHWEILNAQELLADWKEYALE